jgi:hypothetical protein
MPPCRVDVNRGLSGERDQKYIGETGYEIRFRAEIERPLSKILSNADHVEQ